MWTLFRRNARQTKPAPRKLAPVRPHLEALEDRCLLNAGSLDPTFGNGAGYVTTSTTPYTDAAYTALIQPNGDIVAVGNAGTSSSGHEFGVERYNSNGSLDTSFGSGGVALASFGSQSAVGLSGALYPAGTANAGDIVEEGEYNYQYQILARFNTNGTLDTTFGTGGEVMTAIPSMSFINENGGVVVTSTGQIVALSIDGYTNQFALARYNANGSLDTTFGQGGFVITTVPNMNGSGIPTLLQQPDGTLIVTTAQAPPNSANVWDLYAFNANGTPDTSFGNQGIVTTAAPGGPYAATLYFNAGSSNDGQIVVIGGTGNNSNIDELARYNANGSLDTTFGTGGLEQTSFNFIPEQAAVDANGRFVVTGDEYGGSATELARFNVNGTPDTTFGNGGLVTTTFGNGSTGQAVAIYPNAGAPTDGDIVVAGRVDNGTKDNVLVARYLAQANAPYFQITGPSSVTAGTTGSFTVTALNANGTIDTGYIGTVQFSSSSDPQAVLPANYTFTAADQGVYTFSATLVTAGSQSITATDTSNGSIIGSDSGIVVQPAAASQLILSAPSSVSPGTKFSVTVTVEDAYGNVVTGYVGTIHFSSSDSSATLPKNYTFTTADAGVHTFTNVFIFQKKGKQTLTVTDVNNSSLTATDTINVT
jgi:uncharacterized delta-60 repeat protein